MVDDDRTHVAHGVQFSSVGPAAAIHSPRPRLLSDEQIVTMRFSAAGWGAAISGICGQRLGGLIISRQFASFTLVDFSVAAVGTVRRA